jgi:hypothetical protein
MKESDCTGGRAALQEGLAGDGKTMLARENFGGPHVCLRRAQSSGTTAGNSHKIFNKAVSSHVVREPMPEFVDLTIC